MQAKLRKIQDYLVISGLAVIAFGFWSLIKSVVFFILNKDMSAILDEAAIPDEFRGFAGIVAGAFLFFIFSTDIGLRLIVGLNARAEGRGIKRGIGYIVIAVILAAGSFFSFGVYMISAVRQREIIDLVLTGVVELTSAGTLVLLIITAIMNRQFLKTPRTEREV